MTRPASRGRHRRRRRASRTAEVAVPLAVGTVVAGAALVGTALDGLLHQDSDTRSASGPDDRERGTLLSFPADPAAQPLPEASASASPPSGLGAARDGSSPADAVPDGAGGTAGAADRSGRGPQNGPTPRAADGPDGPDGSTPDGPDGSTPGDPPPSGPPSGGTPPSEPPPEDPPPTVDVVLPAPLPSLPLPTLPLSSLP